MADRMGQQLGNYRLLRLLGRGGFADVYLGEHVHLNTLAAIKVLDTHLSSEGREQFRDEARTIARLEHPNIVRVLDFGVVDAVPYLVMSYALNGSLRQQHPSGTRLPLATIIAYVKQIAAALDYAHEQKVMHRDVKPENMLLGRNAEVLLSDFGLAMGTYSSSQDGVRDASGTIAYMAPEQSRGKPRPASDQYALAVAVYEWLCGARPFDGTYAEIAVQHVLHDPPSLCRSTPDISLEVEAVVLKALAKDPHQRFGTVQEFASALELAHHSGTLSGKLKSMSPVDGPPLHETSSTHERTQTPAIYAVAWSPDRRRIVTGGHDCV
ncbi:MAG TPA: serine/threonine-protein kinase, partial [Ktedonobacteraceae bacterium]|nr:serine/threonine-protein kinase [Ktedonobacteraceae bacterium]